MASWDSYSSDSVSSLNKTVDAIAVNNAFCGESQHDTIVIDAEFRSKPDAGANTRNRRQTSNTGLAYFNFRLELCG